MNVLFRAKSLIGASIFVLSLSSVSAAPFIPLEWQSEVEAGPFQGEQKHLNWNRDADGDLIDDQLNELDPGDRSDVVVQLSTCPVDTTLPDEVAAKLSGYGDVSQVGTLLGYAILKEVRISDLDELVKEPIVAAVEFPSEMKIFLDTSTRSIRVRPSNTYSPDTFADSFGLVGTGVNIAIMDTGVDNGVHNALPGTRFVSGYDGINRVPGDPDDNHNGFSSKFHGTHVAGTAMGLGVGLDCSPADDGSLPNNCEGIATGTGLVDVKVLSWLGGGTYQDLINGIEWVWTDGQTNVVNMSLGDDSHQDGTTAAAKAIDALVANNIAVAVAAGNSGRNELGHAASASLAVTVANSDDQDTVDPNDDLIASDSTFGPRVDFDPANVLVGMLKPDVAAPGKNIVSALGDSVDGYQSMSGTSMASPHVAGAMALLLDMRPDLPPGSLKDLLKRSAFVTPDHATAGPSYPSVDPIYNVNWGFGLIDIFAAGEMLNNGVTDVSFTDCTGPHPNYPDTRRCARASGSSWANSVDIQLAEDPPVKSEANTVNVKVENRGPSTAENVSVCIGIKEFGVGTLEFYDVGCREIAQIATGAIVTVSLPWTPTDASHQCIQASIDYGLDTEFSNNLTQRNVTPVSVPSSATSTEFRVENPLNEPATLQTAMLIEDPAQVFSKDTNLPQEIRMGPEECPKLFKAYFAADPNAAVGTKGTAQIVAVARPDSDPSRAVELSGIQFDLEVAEPETVCNGLPATIIGTPGNDRLIGTSGDDVIAGLGGDDHIIGGSGNDCIKGGEGRDYIVLGSGDDIAYGGDQDDQIIAGSGSDVVYGGRGNDRVTGGSGNDEIFGEQGADVIDGNSGSDQLYGGSGYDRIDGGSGRDTCVNGEDVTRCL